MRVVVADDSLLIREGLVRLLGEARCDVVGSAGDVAQLLDVIHGAEPDVVIVDIKMPPTFTDEGITAPVGSASPARRSVCWCYPITSSRSTPCACSPTYPSAVVTC